VESETELIFGFLVPPENPLPSFAPAESFILWWIPWNL
jgi:hypothetical protein